MQAKTQSSLLQSDELRLRVLRLVEQNPTANQRDIAKELGISLGGVNYCLRALVEKGFIKAGNVARSKNKKAYAYLLTPEGVAKKADLTVRYLRLKLAEYEILKKEIAALEIEVQTID
jgi:EPS-associated MarR family transcriptional regulator